MLATYPAVFENSEKYGYSVVFPDLNYLATEGKTYEEAMAMAVEALASYLWELDRAGETPPAPSKVESLTLEGDEYPVIVTVDPVAYAKEHFEKPVKKTLTIPKWLNDLAVQNGVKFSKVLQKALKQELGIYH